MVIAAETINVLLCTLADEHYALPMADVREVIRWRAPTLIPGTPNTILGVIHHRGAVLPLLDIRPLLGLGAAPTTRSTRLAVVERDGIQAGVLCDGVTDIIDLDGAAIEPPPPSLPAAQQQYVNGLIFWNDQPVALLQLPPLFTAVKATNNGA